MRNSEYFRAQARLYRDIASFMTDRKAADRVLHTATEYLQRAMRLEQAERTALEHHEGKSASPLVKLRERARRFLSIVSMITGLAATTQRVKPD